MLVLRTEAAARCELHGHYVLAALPHSRPPSAACPCLGAQPQPCQPVPPLTRLALLWYFTAFLVSDTARST